MYRSALVALKPDRPNDAVVRFAVDTAKRHGWKLTGISVLDRDRVTPAEAVPLGGSAFKSSRDEAVLARAKAAATATLNRFRDACAAAGIPAETLFREEPLSRAIASVVPACDILLVGHTAGTDVSGPGEDDSALTDIVKSCPRPAVVVPSAPAGGSSIVVAYDASVQAARALGAFVASDLGRQTSIQVVSFHNDQAEVWRLASAGADFLRMHGLDAAGHGELLSRDPAEMILNSLTTHSARMLVMGAYGQSTIRDFLFGSVSRTILRSVHIPVFLDH
jgi:nucleotide-binding universal stress UspA family protein